MSDAKVDVNTQLLEKGISHAVYLERYKTQAVREAVTLLNRCEKDLAQRLAKYTGEGFTRLRLERLLADIRDINADAYAELRIGLNGEFKEFAVYESGFQIRRLGETIPITWNIVQPAPSQLWAAVTARPFEGKYLKDYFTVLKAASQERLEKTLRMGFVEGWSQTQIMRSIIGSRKLGYTNGIQEISRKSVGSWVRTALNHIATTARERTYQENDDLIDQVQYVATLDNRTTLICANYDGNIYPIDSGPRPPQHWGCRSTTVPKTKSWRQLGLDLQEAPTGTRASMNGQVPAVLTFPAWLRKQDARTQREVLGATRYQLYKDGMSIDRFVVDGRVLRLDELRKREDVA